MFLNLSNFKICGLPEFLARMLAGEFWDLKPISLKVAEVEKPGVCVCVYVCTFLFCYKYIRNKNNLFTVVAQLYPKQCIWGNFPKITTQTYIILCCTDVKLVFSPFILTSRVKMYEIC